MRVRKENGEEKVEWELNWWELRGKRVYQTSHKPARSTCCEISKDRLTKNVVVSPEVLKLSILKIHHMLMFSFDTLVQISLF